jgi:threonine/homoserine/homoserine lactone efflux protein
MTAWQIAWFAGALAVAAAVPGPAVMATIGRVLTRGERGSLEFCLGLLLGDLVWLWIATLGLGAASDVFGPALRWGQLLGAGYLLVLAWRMATSAPVAPDATTVSDHRAWVSGLVLQLGNPKAMLFYAALVPAIVPLDALTLAHVAVLSTTVAIVLFAINLAYVKTAALARRYIRTPRALRTIYRVNALVLGAVAIAIAVAALHTGEAR